MGFKRYLLWNDAIYGYTSNRFSFNRSFPPDCLMVTIGSVWTVKIISLI